MGYMDKQNELLLKLRETNYEVFDGDKDEALDFVGDSLTAFPNYANVVIREQIMTPIWRDRCEPEDFRENVERIDRQRRDAHDCAIDSINMLNRLNDRLGLEPMFDVDTTDRHAVAECVGKYVNEVYNDGIGSSFDDATYQKSQEYNPKKITDRLKNTIDTLDMQTETRNDYGFDRS